jgi:sodium-dependent dicarboxylate transporter 2/3/5
MNPAPRSDDPVEVTTVRPWRIALVAAAAIAVGLSPIPSLSPRAHGTLVVLVVAAGLWMSEAVPVAWAALQIPVLAVALGIADAKAAFAGFGDPILFLFFGTFLLTTAAADHGLNARLTRAVLGASAVRRDPTRLLWAVALLGCGASAWMNNTATTALILPLALTAEGLVPRRLMVGVLLMAAYGPSLGGIATPVGSAPNLIGLRLLEAGAGVHVSFARWCALFAPLALLSTALAAFHLRWIGGSREPVGSGTGAPATVPPLASLPVALPWSRAERTLVVVYAVVVLLWILPGILLATPLREQGWLVAWNRSLPETCVPLLGALVLFLLPSGDGKARILEVGALGRIDWSTLMLFGGGLSLGNMMFETGLARAIGEWIFAAMPLQGTTGIVLAATLMAVFVSEVTSNTASASLVVPVVLALAQVAGVDPVKPALAATVACSFGFMLPVSTPPNALVYATGRVPIGAMIRTGCLLDLLGVVTITAWVVWLA